VKLKVFSRDPTTGKWDLGKDTLLDVPDRPTYFPYVHLSWSHLGNDLAVVDAVGHVMIFSSAMALDRMLFMRSDSPQPETEMDAVVGMQWLAISPYELKVSALLSLVK
jgi:mediator of RNA polymerase II transcription subunit 16